MKTTSIIIVILIGISTALCAQPPQPGGAPPSPEGFANQPPQPGMMPPAMAQLKRGREGGMFSGLLFEPETVMQNQRALGLTDEQTSAIKSEMHQSMMKFTELQWQQSSQVEIVTNLLQDTKTSEPRTDGTAGSQSQQKDKMDEPRTLQEFDKLMNLENQIKRLRLQMLIRVRNILSPEQREKLRTLQDTPENMRPDRGGHGPNQMHGSTVVPPAGGMSQRIPDASAQLSMLVPQPVLRFPAME